MCNSCDEEIQNEEVKCHNCEGNLHFRCSIAETVYRKKNDEEKKAWKCKKCIEKTIVEKENRICGGCGEEVTGIEVFCTGCNSHCHHECSYSIGSWKGKSVDKKKEWRCYSCKGKKWPERKITGARSRSGSTSSQGGRGKTEAGTQKLPLAELGRRGSASSQGENKEITTTESNDTKNDQRETRKTQSTKRKKLDRTKDSDISSGSESDDESSESEEDMDTGNEQELMFKRINKILKLGKKIRNLRKPARKPCKKIQRLLQGSKKRQVKRKAR